MLTKIATIVVVLTLALGGAGIIAASAQGDGQGGTESFATKLMAKFSSDETREAPAQTKAFTQNAARSGETVQDPFEFQFGTQEEFVPGNPWESDTIGTLEVSGFGYGGHDGQAKQTGAGKAAKP